jgi:hypothetical protein
MDPLDTCVMLKDDVGIRLCTCEGSRTRVDSTTKWWSDRWLEHVDSFKVNTICHGLVGVGGLHAGDPTRMPPFGWAEPPRTKRFPSSYLIPIGSNRMTRESICPTCPRSCYEYCLTESIIIIFIWWYKEKITLFYTIPLFHYK